MCLAIAVNSESTSLPSESGVRILLRSGPFEERVKNKVYQWNTRYRARWVLQERRNAGHKSQLSSRTEFQKRPEPDLSESEESPCGKKMSKIEGATTIVLPELHDERTNSNIRLTVLVLLCCQNAGHALLTRYSRVRPTPLS